MNDFIKNASAEMTENYNTSELFPRMNDKVLPDEKTIENIIHKTRRLVFPGYFGDESLAEMTSGVFEDGLLIDIYSSLKKQIKLALIYRCKCEKD